MRNEVPLDKAWNCSIGMRSNYTLVKSRDKRAELIADFPVPVERVMDLLRNLRGRREPEPPKGKLQ